MEIISLWRFKDTVLSTTQSPWPYGLLPQSPLAALLALAIFAILPAASALPATIGTATHLTN